jgi:hypothetical protein
MTARRSVRTRLLLAATLAAGIAATHPVQAQPFNAYVAGAGPAQVAHSPFQRGVVITGPHYVPPADDRFDPAPPLPANADVLPGPHDDADAPSVKLMPSRVHYEHAPIGLDDSPTTMGLVAKF